MVVAQGDTLCFVTVGIESNERGRLWRGQQVAPIVKFRGRQVNGAHLLAVCCDNIAAYIAEGQALYLWRKKQHVITFRHLVACHRREQADDVRFVGTDNEVEALLRFRRVGSHVLLV